jgi:hypothetical protein
MKLKMKKKGDIKKETFIASYKCLFIVLKPSKGTDPVTYKDGVAQTVKSHLEDLFSKRKPTSQDSVLKMGGENNLDT